MDGHPWRLCRYHGTTGICRYRVCCRRLQSERCVELVTGRDRPLALMLLGVAGGCAVYGWAQLVPGSAYLAGDYRVFYSAGLMVRMGSDPYHLVPLMGVEQAVRHLYLPATDLRSGFAYMPIVALALGALTLIPFWVSFTLFVAISSAATLWSGRSLAAKLGWEVPWAAGLAALLVWPSAWSLLEGQWDGLLLAGTVGIIQLRLRDRGFAAGVACTVTWLKPQLLLPLALVVALSFWPQRGSARRVLLGFAVGSLLLIGTQELLVPQLVAPWWTYLIHFAHRIPATQGATASVDGLVGYLPRSLGLTDSLTGGFDLTVLVVTVAISGGVSLWFAWCRGHRHATWFGSQEACISAVALPLGIWLVGTPYDHINDLTLMVPLLLLVVWNGGRGLGPTSAIVGAACFGLLPFIESYLGFRLVLSPIAAVVLCAASAYGVWRAASGGIGSDGLGLSEYPS